MTTITFDTHKFIRTIKESGLPENQAEAIAEAFRAAQIEADIATKTDIHALEAGNPRYKPTALAVGDFILL